MEATPARTLAGAILMAAAVLQGKMALKLLRTQRRAPRNNCFRHRNFWRTLFVGTGLCYVASMLLGPDPATPFVFAALIGLWNVAAVLWIAADSKILDHWKQLAQNKAPRKSAAIVQAIVIAAGSLELSLHAYEWLAPSKFGRSLGQVNMASLVEQLPSFAGRNETTQYDGDSRFHIAIVGDEVALGGIHNDGALSQLEVMVPGVRVTNFSVPHAGPREYASQLSERVAACHPDLVLTFVSVGDDILADAAGGNWFDWRALKTAQLFVSPDAKPQTAGSARDVATSSRSKDEHAEFLKLRGQELTVCRTPIDSGTAKRWKQAFAQLDALEARCQASSIDLALVFVPSEVQVNTVLLETVRRRMGYDAQQLDLELPQRKLAAFANERRLPFVDLLPHLRSSDEPTYQRHDAGWTTAGTSIALKTVGGWLQSRYGNDLVAATQLTRK